MPRPFVSDIRENQRVNGVYLATRKSLLVTRNGAPYLGVTLVDRTGEIEGRVWEDAERLDQAFEKGAYVRVDGVASEYNGRLQLKLDALRPVPDDEVDPKDFLPASRFDVDLMWRELNALVDGLGEPHLRALLRSLLDDPRIGPALRQAPAAKGVHHPFLGGLLEHTLSVVQLAHRVADHYPRVDRDLLVAGAVLHDLGKTAELSWERGLDYTTQGRLVGHLVLCAQWIHERAKDIHGFPPALETHLVHLVAAHHGETENGSPKVPQTLEAMLLHCIDELDSRVQSFIQIMSAETHHDAAGEWSDFQRLYDRYLFRGPGWGPDRPPAGERWAGASLYRREAQGDAVHAPGAQPPAPAKPRAATREARAEPRPERHARAEPAEAPPVPKLPDLFARRG